MQSIKQQVHKSEGLFIYLLLLTCFYLLLELSYFIQCNRAYLSDYEFMADNLRVPSTIWPGILFFIFAQLAVHFAYCVMVWIVVELSASVLRLSSDRKIIFGIAVWIASIAAIITANQIYHPNSKLVELSSLILFNRQMTIGAMLFLSACCSGALLLALIGLIKQIIRRSILYLPLLIGLAGATWFIFHIPGMSASPDAATSTRPNVILIGIDSLRPDFLSYFGSERSTPFFDSFLNQSSVFSEAVTPLARTFPSWTGILSGQYPKQTGIRSNLAQQRGVNLVNTLPAILKRYGYETIYATDETRFSNIDTNFGLDHVITPPMGLNDFLIGTFNDFPISNLIINTSIGKWLFPYSYANRPVYFTYEPDSFISLVKSALPAQRTRPVFLAIHFCLPHYPYLWSSLSGSEFTPQERYVESILKADQQVKQLFIFLRQSHYLDHAVVVLLSDHGEALELPGDRITEKDLFISSDHKKSAIPRFYPPSLDNEDVNRSAGHGTDVLGLPQYHSLLAFRLFGTENYRKGVVTGVVSLLDIKPTILNLLNIPAPDSSGISLADAITGAGKPELPPQHIFLESDFSPEAIRTVYPETRKVLMEGIELFQIDPVTTRLTVKNDMNDKIIRSKQYADIYGVWMLALYPQNNHYRMPILINLETGKWTNDLTTSFARQSPAQVMLKKLKAFYGNEISST
jgi:arylsulfatase A-like enzyme